MANLEETKKGKMVFVGESDTYLDSIQKKPGKKVKKDTFNSIV